jgi:hypothetical protein
VLENLMGSRNYDIVKSANDVCPTLNSTCLLSSKRYALEKVMLSKRRLGKMYQQV